MAKNKGLSNAKKKASAFSKTSSQTFDKNTELARRGSVKKIHDSSHIELEPQDQYFEDRDKILFQQDSDNHSLSSETEVFGLGQDESSSSDSDLSSADDNDYNSDASQASQSELSDEDAAWGSRKQAYYNKDEILASSDEEQAENDEESEAIRLQKRLFSSLSASDFLEDHLSISSKSPSSKLNSLPYSANKISSFSDLFESDFTSLATSNTPLHFKVDKNAQLAQINKMSLAEKKKLVASRYPELLGLLQQLRSSNNLASEYNQIIQKFRHFFGSTITKKNKEFLFLESLYQLHLLLISNISFYLILLSSDDPSISNISDHPVFTTINKTLDTIDIFDVSKDIFIKTLLYKIHLKSIGKFENQSDNTPNAITQDDSDLGSESDISSASESSYDSDQDEPISQKQSKSDKVSKKTDFSNRDFIKLQKKYSNAKSTNKNLDSLLDSNSGDMQDFGEQVALNNTDAIDKSTNIENKKLSLRYIANRAVSSKLKKQKAKAQQALVGDLDLPYAERSKFKIVDEKDQHQNSTKFDAGTELDLNPNDSDKAQSDDSKNEYYNEIKKSAKKNKRAKAAVSTERKSDAWKQVLEENIEIETMQAVETGDKRPINYQILKNKGLTPKRRKIDRNPRVKRKVKYEAAKKKLSSIRKTYKVPTSSYGGETTGIKSHLSKSTKF
ncbi:hypothetical protein BB561_001974 [Smittium simulii]|uniref:Sas10 C-terminal domain-containing protein n=1 Tax=Smittium simulii TaxID=133385 RepID=A0A2T9YS74_9FUNG|nr:hypothetical protein BB561_001974 [Smittium simulii]